MLLVLAGLDDAPALWFAHALRRRGDACTIVTSEVLSFACRRSHRVGMRGVRSVVELADGTVLDDTSVHGVLNRLPAPPDLAWRRASAPERQYAAAELHAFVMSWLAALPCPVRNRPSEECLAGPSPHPLVAAHAASLAGLRVARLELGTASAGHVHTALADATRFAAGARARLVQVLCLDGVAVHDSVPADVRAGIARFAAAIGAGDALIGVDMLVSHDQWWFAGVTPLPELRLGGAAIVERLSSVLQSDLVGAR
jgi:hypothetical protein